MSYLTDIFPRRPSPSGPLLEGACLTAEERDLAYQMCDSVTIKGIGTIYDDWAAGSRWPWPDYNACEIANLPLCPACTDQWSAAAIFGCLAGSAPAGWTTSQHDNWCAQVGAGMMLQPICGGIVQPLPSCADDSVASVLNYCQYYGFGGPIAELNAACWLADKGGYLGEALALPPCPTAAPVPPPGPTPAPPPAPPPPITYTPTAVPPAEEPPEEGPLAPPEEAPEEQRMGMMLPGLILLLVLGGGVAYYTAQRRKKPGQRGKRRRRR